MALATLPRYLENLPCPLLLHPQERLHIQTSGTESANYVPYLKQGQIVARTLFAILSLAYQVKPNFSPIGCPLLYRWSIFLALFYICFPLNWLTNKLGHMRMVKLLHASCFPEELFNVT